MSISVCITGLIAEGQIKQGQAVEAERLYDQHFKALKRQMGMSAAASVASERTIASLRAQHTRRQLLAAQTIATRERVTADLKSYNGGKGGDTIDPRAGPALLGADERAPYANVEGRSRAVRARAHGMIDGILAKHSSDVTGRVRNGAELGDLVREAFGENTGSLSARELAGAWGEAAEMLRQRFNAAGGDVGQIERWGLPQAHDPRQVRAAGYDAWRAEIEPRLDRQRMIDRDTGQPFEDDRFEEMLRDTFDSIRSDGWSRREPGSVAQGALANRRQDSRFLVFRTADDWMAYAEKFGSGNGFDAMMGHIDGMSRDIALLEVLGPNPGATVKWVKDSLDQAAARDVSPDSKGKDQAFAAGRKMDRMFAELTGTATRPENRTLALTFSALRSWQTAAKLGSAVVTAVPTDTAFQIAARKFNGLPAASLLRDYAKLMKPGSQADQRLAVRLGLIADEWANRTASQGRFLGEELTGEVSRRLAEGVLRVSGLARHTQASRWAFGMEMLGHMTDERGKGFEQLDPAFRRMFERHGIDAGDWDKIRATPLEADGGADWIKPANVEDQRLGDRLLELISRESDFATPVPDLNTKSMLNNLGGGRGTLPGELLKSTLLFKSFGVSLMLMQANRIMAMAGANRLRYTAGLAIGTTLAGAMALMLKDIAAGRDPRTARDIPFYDEKKGELELNPGFWGQAMIQGGGFGIFGDFLKSSTSRAGGGLAGTVAGPLVGDAQLLAQVATSKNHAGAALKFARSQLPGGSLWYARLAFDRAIADQIQEAVDPQYRQSWRRMRKWADEQGTGYFWAPGDTTPERAPDFSKIAEGETRQ